MMPFALALVLSQVKTIDLPDGYVRVATPAYSFEIPKGWVVGAQTAWGARDLKPATGNGSLGTMTAPPTKAGWDELYRTSLYFIQREGPGKATPYKVERTKQGYEACSFSVIDKAGFASRRYTLLKDSSGRVLALSVKIPGKESAKALEPVFARFVSSARIRG